MTGKRLIVIIHGVGPFDESVERANVLQLMSASTEADKYDVVAFDWRFRVPASLREQGLHTRPSSHISAAFESAVARFLRV